MTSLSSRTDLFDKTKLETLPAPWSHLIGSSVYTPPGRRGWIGYEQEGDGSVVLWHVCESRAIIIEFERIYVYRDPQTGNIWMVFHRENEKSLPVILYADEVISPSYVPPVIRQMIGE
jgi:hypothetical protein